MNYFDFNDNKTKKRRTGAPALVFTGCNCGRWRGHWPECQASRFETVEIDSYLVTETSFPVTETPPEAHSGNDRQGHSESSTNDRHGWHCPCVMCRSDRGEE